MTTSNSLPAGQLSATLIDAETILHRAAALAAMLATPEGLSAFQQLDAAQQHAIQAEQSERITRALELIDAATA